MLGTNIGQVEEQGVSFVKVGKKAWRRRGRWVVAIVSTAVIAWCIRSDPG